MLAAKIPSALTHLRAVDPIMGGIIDRAGEMRLQPRRLSPFQSLVQAIIYQQLSGKAAGTIFTRFQVLFPPGNFPTPQLVLEMEVERMRGAGVSRQKVGYILDLAQKALSQVLPSLEECDSLTDEELIERLTQVKGIGRWTAEMLLIFNLGRPDVLPIHDLGVRRGYQIAYHKRSLPKPTQLERQGEKWRPYRTTAAWYLWRVLDAQGGAW